MNKRKWMIAAALLMSALLLGGCATALLGPEKTSDTATGGASEDNAATIVVAEVNGEAVYKDAFNKAYDELVSMYSYYGLDTTTEDVISSIQQEALDTVINEEIFNLKMAELGYADLTDEEIAQAEEDMYAEIYEYIEYNYLDAIIETLEENYTDEELKAAEETYVDTVLEGSGYTRETYLDLTIDNIIYNKAYEGLVGDIVPAEDEIKAQYDENIAADQQTMAEDPTSYITNVNSGATVYYTPAGVRRVRQVLISVDTELQDAISVLREQGYDTAAQILLDKGLADIEAQANDVLEKINSGEITFDEAITQYNGDTGMPAEGYPMMADTTYYVDSFTEGAMGLTQIGEHTGLVASDYGYHIIEYYADVTEGSVAYDAVKDVISEDLQLTQQNEAWDELMTQWTSEATIVRYEENL